MWGLTEAEKERVDSHVVDAEEQTCDDECCNYDHLQQNTLRFEQPEPLNRLYQ